MCERLTLPIFPGHETIALLDEGPAREVYSARELEHGRAVKIVSLAVGLSSESPYRSLIAAEAKTLRSLDHPAFPTVLSESNGKENWFSYAAPSGRPLSEERRKLEPAQIRSIIAELASALGHAHARDVFHGQLTAADVTLTAGGGVFMENCGRNAELESSFAPLPKRRLGSSSPEQLLGEQAGAAGDAFALGAILYELLSGEPPFGPPGDQDFARRVRKETPPKLDSRLPRDLTELCSQLLEKRPEVRPSDLRALARRLQGGESPTRHSSTTFGARALALTLGVSLLALAAGYFVGTFSKDTTTNLPGLRSTAVLPKEDAILLRVVATPWAHVYVDGVLRETTPFAEPLRLPPGRHEVKLVHPNAPTETRSIDGARGQLVFLDVAMHISALPSTQEVNEVERDTTP